MSYHIPIELSSALALLEGEAFRIIAGGTDVYPAIGRHTPEASWLDITRIEALRGISQIGSQIRIGATTPWSEIAHADLPRAFAGLQSAAREIGSVQIQNAGTVGGNLCNASPAADAIPPLLCLEAQVELISAARGTRKLPLSDFVTGVRQTALERDELVVALHIPAPPQGALGGFHKLGSRKYLVISIAMTSVLLHLDGQGRIQELRIAIGACANVAKRLGLLEQEAVGQMPQALHLEPRHFADLSPIDDIRASKSYREDVLAAQCRYAIEEALHAF